MSSYQYWKSDCGDKMVVRSSYLHNGISYTCKMASLYWIRPLGQGFIDGVIVWYCAVPLWCVQFSHKYSQNTPHSSPVRPRYGVSFVDPASDWCSASVPAIIYAISYDIVKHFKHQLFCMIKIIIKFGNKAHALSQNNKWTYLPKW